MNNATTNAEGSESENVPSIRDYRLHKHMIGYPGRVNLFGARIEREQQMPDQGEQFNLREPTQLHLRGVHDQLHLQESNSNSTHLTLRAAQYPTRGLSAAIRENKCNSHYVIFEPASYISSLVSQTDFSNVGPAVTAIYCGNISTLLLMQIDYESYRRNSHPIQ